MNNVVKMEDVARNRAIKRAYDEHVSSLLTLEMADGQHPVMMDVLYTARRASAALYEAYELPQLRTSFLMLYPDMPDENTFVIAEMFNRIIPHDTIKRFVEVEVAEDHTVTGEVIFSLQLIDPSTVTVDQFRSSREGNSLIQELLENQEMNARFAAAEFPGTVPWCFELLRLLSSTRPGLDTARTFDWYIERADDQLVVLLSRGAYRLRATLDTAKLLRLYEEWKSKFKETPCSP